MTLIYKLFYTKKRKQIGFGLMVGVIWIGQVVNGFRLNYPPSAEQIGISLINVDIIRLISASGLLFSLYLIYKFVAGNFGEVTAVVTISLLCISPTLTAMWLEKPIYCLFFLLISMSLRFFKSKWWLIIIPAIVAFNYWQWESSMPASRAIDLEKSKNEVNQRFLAEDSLAESIKLPHFFRRAAYNKYLLTTDKILRLGLSYFDIDSWYFQEIHPNGSKSQIMFFWPTVGLFVLGFWKVFNKFDDKTKTWLKLAVWSIVFYGFSDGPTSLRHSLSLLPLAIMAGVGMNALSKWKWLVVWVVMLIAYGYQASWFDLKERTAYWFDNRPLAYSFIFKNIEQEEGNVYVTNLLGDSRKYCQYYLGKKCDVGKINFGGFDLKTKTADYGLYAGFIGEYLGSDYNNNFGDDWQKKIEAKGLRIIKTEKLNDSVAFRYGDYLVVAKKE